MIVNDNLPVVIKKHIGKNIELSEIDSIDSQWQKKYKLYLEIVEKNSMYIVDDIRIEDRRGLLLFSYSGSIIFLGSETKKGRSLKYCRLNSRTDTPHYHFEDKIRLLNDISIGRILYFDAMYFKNTSPIYKIAVAK